MNAMKPSIFAGFVLFGLLSPCWTFYLPGLAPVSYCAQGHKTQACSPNIPLWVNRLDSIESVIPYEYDTFDFCHASDAASSPTENLGQVVFGERIRPSVYNITFDVETKCKVLCEKTYKEDDEKLKFIREGIALNYQNYWIIDNMPVTWCYDVSDQAQPFCSPGFPIGCLVDKDGNQKDACVMSTAFASPSTYYIFNHVDIEIGYHKEQAEYDGVRLVSAKITPKSIKHATPEAGKPVTCDEGSPMGIPEKLTGELKFKYSYSVTFKENTDIKWASRWDYILSSMPHTRIQWSSIMNSLVIVLFLSGMVAKIMLRNFHKDIARYNQMDNGEDAQKTFGWELVHGDVCRPPRKAMFLSVTLGTGAQIFFMVFITLVFACLGFLSPANRGALMTCVLVLFVCLGTPAGYISARLYKMFGGELWKTNVLMTSFLYPGIIFGFFFLLNLVLWIKASSAAVPFTTLLALLALWFGISVPLTFLGAYMGFKKKAIEHPVRTNQIPRQIPDQSIYTRPLPGIIMGGVLPFGCIFIQLFFILNSIWSHQIYYMFGFLFMVALILVITCSETCVLLCYFHLCAGDYHWWWRSFLTGGCTAFYLFLYSIHFFNTKLTITGATSTFLYFGYTFIMVILFYLMCGAIGFFACFFFVRKIYSPAFCTGCA